MYIQIQSVVVTSETPCVCVCARERENAEREKQQKTVQKYLRKGFKRKQKKKHLLLYCPLVAKPTGPHLKGIKQWT